MEPWYRQGDSDPHAYFSGRFLDLIKRFELLSLKRAHYLCYTKESAVSTNSTIPAYSVQQLLKNLLFNLLCTGVERYSGKVLYCEKLQLHNKDFRCYILDSNQCFSGCERTAIIRMQHISEHTRHFLQVNHDLDIPCSRVILIGSRTLHDVFQEHYLKLL